MYTDPRDSRPTSSNATVQNRWRQLTNTSIRFYIYSSQSTVFVTHYGYCIERHSRRARCIDNLSLSGYSCHLFKPVGLYLEHTENSSLLTRLSDSTPSCHALATIRVEKREPLFSSFHWAQLVHWYVLYALFYITHSVWRAQEVNFIFVDNC